DLIEEMKVWLLKQKQVTNWKTPVATADAVYALLCHGNDLLANLGDVRITLGKKVMKTLASSQDVLPGLASVRETFTENSPEVKAKSITIEKLDDGIAWGAVYAQYLEAISQVKQHGGELGIEKQLYVERTLANGSKQLQRIVPGMQLSVGDKVISRLVLRLDRAMDFVQLKDQRGACFEPVESISGYHWNHGAGYYLEIKDASSNFFFDHLDKGVHVLESGYHVARAGEYESGLAIVQSAYAPEYAAHSTSMKVKTAN
ncbi:MAG: alpha-2-macroglobulin, partial [Bacteroides sp.]|nr:alpha-2-macroglobulin [Bacteroides sp.]